MADEHMKGWYAGVEAAIDNIATGRTINNFGHVPGVVRALEWVLMDLRGMVYPGPPPEDRMTTVNPDLQPGGKGPCVGCSAMTIYCCPFCKIKAGKIVWLCEKAECREKHEATKSCARS